MKAAATAKETHMPCMWSAMISSWSSVDSTCNTPTWCSAKSEAKRARLVASMAQAQVASSSTVASATFTRYIVENGFE